MLIPQTELFPLESVGNMPELLFLQIWGKSLNPTRIWIWGLLDIMSDYFLLSVKINMKL